MKTLAIIQARTSSRRLPGKVLADLAGKPMAVRVFERVKQCSELSHVIVATSTDPSDDGFAEVLREHGIPCFRGDLDDVLGRFYSAAQLFSPEFVVRITADCPLIDPKIIGSVVRKLRDDQLDYVSNCLPPTFPDGLDAEAFCYDCLTRAAEDAGKPSEREHVTPWLRDLGNGLKIGNVENGEDFSGLRWTVDDPDDLEFARRVFAHFGDNEFSWENVLSAIGDGTIPGNHSVADRNEGAAESLNDEARETGRGQRLYERARNLIPGGTQLLSKRPEMFLPDRWPAYYSRAKGCEVWDLDSNHYYDFSNNGIGTCLLGASDPDVDAAVKQAIERGSMSTLNCSEEVELGELLCELHPWADQARFCRTGGEAMAIAVRIARAATSRDKVVFCGYHGWHDWYLSANLASDQALDGHLLPGLNPHGVPRQLAGTTFAFQYNNLASLRAILNEHDGQIAAIVMEPVRGEWPKPGFLEEVRRLATAQGAVFVFDECTAGFRHAHGGAHLKFGIDPDIAMFAKAMSNGYAMAAVIGKREVMSAAEGSFISSSYWTERIGPSAALATIRKLRRINAPSRLHDVSCKVRAVWEKAVIETGVEIQMGGLNPLPVFSFVHSSQEAKTFFTQEMLKQGFLATPSFYATTVHSDSLIEKYRVALRIVFEELQSLKTRKALLLRLDGPVAHNGFQRLVK